mmetsp:Transcript_10913/g.19080  ORF Transcript_10913/g.19080 Transcript_10913/m.19080 type:complete len:376 (-) Transcript_10913:118-1245(-)
MKFHTAICLAGFAALTNAERETSLRGGAQSSIAAEDSASISVESNQDESERSLQLLKETNLFLDEERRIAPPPTPPPSPPLPPPPKIITLGDSYSSGTGLYQEGHEYDEEFGGFVSPWKLTARADNECWRETNQVLAGPVYAAQVGRQSVFLACKGAEAEHFENQIDLLNSLYPSDMANGWSGSTILFTIGGNDIRTCDGEDWPTVLEACITESDCHEESGNQVGNWNTIASRVASAYEKLAVAAPGAKIRVLAYPRMFQRLTAWYEPIKCPGVTGVNRHEADWADDNIDDLNNILNQAVNNVKANHPGLDIKFVSVNSYITRGACRSTNRQINDKVCTNTSTDLCFSSDNISDSSFHPSNDGYVKYRDAFMASL